MHGLEGCRFLNIDSWTGLWTERPSKPACELADRTVQKTAVLRTPLPSTDSQKGWHFED